MQPLRIVSTGLALLSLLLLLLALGSDYWLMLDRSSGHGLWKSCSPTECAALPSMPEYFDVTRAFLFLGMIAGGISSGVLLASFFCSHLGPVPLTLVSAVGSFSAGLCAMIAMAVFTAESAEYRKQSQLTFGWSFGLGWASFPLFLLTGAVTMFTPNTLSS